MDNLTTDFEQYKKDKMDSFKTKKGFEPLSSDIVSLMELEGMQLYKQG
jgi:hypothetical protein